MKLLYEQPRENLYDGEGVVYASSKRFGKLSPIKSVTRLRVTEFSEIGRHRNAQW